MCIHNTTYYDSDHCLPSGSLHSAPISHGDARGGERVNYRYTHTPFHTSYTSPDVDIGTASRLTLASVPVFSAIDQSFESMVDKVDIQPAPHVIDYWFDRLGLSLDPISSRNLSNSIGRLCPSPPLDGNEYVGTFLGVPYCMRHTYGLR